MDYKMIYPLSSQIILEKQPLFRWERSKDADYYELIIEIYNGEEFEIITNIEVTENMYCLPFPLEEGRAYRVSVVAVNDDRKIAPLNAENGTVFMSYIDSKNHPANKGIDYSFRNKFSPEILANYLSRAITMETFHRDPQSIRNNIRFLINVGAKYVMRSFAAFKVTMDHINQFETAGIGAAYVHQLDPDVILEAWVFETTNAGIDEIVVPAWVQKAFNEPIVKRNFNHKAMMFPDGKGVNQHGSGLHTPDITQKETRMFFYYLACSYINLGFESLHLGQTMLMSQNDENCGGYNELVGMIREYAKTHARRGYVLINSHHGWQFPFMNKDGLFLCDFVAEPGSIFDEDDEPHLPSENNPQRAKITPIGAWCRRYKGTTYSGYYSDNLPSLSEFDNFMGPKKLEDLMKPTGKADIPWGFDEISWFANQPKWYRKEFLEYYTEKIKKFNENSYVSYQVSRPIFDIKTEKMTFYFASDPLFLENGFGDEQTIKEIWINDAKSR